MKTWRCTSRKLAVRPRTGSVPPGCLLHVQEPSLYVQEAFCTSRGCSKLPPWTYRGPSARSGLPSWTCRGPSARLPSSIRSLKPFGIAFVAYKWAPGPRRGPRGPKGPLAQRPKGPEGPFGPLDPLALAPLHGPPGPPLGPSGLLGIAKARSEKTRSVFIRRDLTRVGGLRGAYKDFCPFWGANLY